jgi:hypothetical protein
MPAKYYERNLLHWHPEGRSIFIAWRLYGSLPQSFRYHQSKQNQKPRHQFLHFDRCLDEVTEGPLWLKNPSIVEMIEATLQKGANDLHHYNLHGYPPERFSVMRKQLTMRRAPCGWGGR